MQIGCLTANKDLPPGVRGRTGGRTAAVELGRITEGSRKMDVSRGASRAGRGEKLPAPFASIRRASEQIRPVAGVLSAATDELVGRVARPPG
jgi:hypothetical protein